MRGDGEEIGVPGKYLPRRDSENATYESLKIPTLTETLILRLALLTGVIGACLDNRRANHYSTRRPKCTHIWLN